jgi:hypothetical protein
VVPISSLSSRKAARNGVSPRSSALRHLPGGHRRHVDAAGDKDLARASSTA